MSDLTGTLAVVTGGSKGIGLAIAQAIVGAGGRVAIAARDLAGVHKAAAHLNGGDPSRAIGVQCDVRSFDDCQRLIDETVRAFGGINVLVNNAGVGRFANVAAMKPDDWHAVIATNLDGVYHCTHAAIPHLRKAGGAWVINIGSLAGVNAFPGGAAYNASKFGLIGFSEALMQELRHDDIRVTCIMPGSVATDFGGPTGTTRDAWKIQPEDLGELVLDLLGTPQRTLPSRIEVRPSKPPRKRP
jgi:NAD(P)-dependent dehydrogenase (short-subunit alcohol dehydrogenase family)